MLHSYVLLNIKTLLKIKLKNVIIYKRVKTEL